MSVLKLTEHEVAAVIPAFNEAATIARVINAVAQYARPIVICDGSSDGTAQIARASGAEVVVHVKNLGYDRALESGLFRAIELEFKFAITMDADGQHDPAILEQFKAELLNGADLVLGVRDRHQRIAESLFAVIGHLLWKISDPLCGVKGYRLSLLKRAGRFDTYTSIGTEFTLRAARAGCKLTQVPICTFERIGYSRFGSGFNANWRIIRAMGLGIMRTRPIKIF
jgi:glycosyltransferase involved in cell wall biosynthesis